MTEYYLIYYAEKGKPDSATHAVIVDGVSSKFAKVIENEIKKRYENKTFGVIFFKKQKTSPSHALKLKHLVDAYEYDHNGYYDPHWKFQRNRVLDEIESWIEDLKTLQDDPNVDWEDSTTPLLAVPDETYYLFARIDNDVRSCVKVAGKQQATAAFYYAKQKVERSLDHDTCYGKGVSCWDATIADDCVISRDTLEGVALATQVRLSETSENLDHDDFDIKFIRHILEFLQCVDAPPPMTQAATGSKGRGIPKNATEVLENYKAFIDKPEEEPPLEVVGKNGEPVIVDISQNSCERIADAFIAKTKKTPLSVKDKDTVKAIEKNTEARPEGFQTGLLRADALSQPAREKAIRTIQEDMLLERGHKPIEVARIHNPDGDDIAHRKASQKISNTRSTKKS
jgi:hypothetical protein